MENDEIWVEIEDYCGRYLVSSRGRVKSSDWKILNARKNGKRTIPGRVLAQTKSGSGYMCTFLRCPDGSGKMKSFLTHRLVAKAFIPNTNNKPCVNHIDGNKTNNNFNNLEWCTYKENMDHVKNMGLKKTNGTARGERSANAKMTNQKVLQIRMAAAEMKKTHKANQIYSELAQSFGMSKTSIRYIIIKKAWAHVEQYD